MNIQFAVIFTKLTIWLTHSLNLQFIIHIHIPVFQLSDITVLLSGEASVQRESINADSLCSICL